MKTLPINNVNFGKFYIYDKDYSSVQEQYISDISSKLNHMNGDSTYSEKIEKLGYNVWAVPSYKGDTIRILLSYAANKDKCVPVASVGDYTTDFAPEKAIKVAEADKKANTIIRKCLLGLAVGLSILALGKCCSEKIKQKSANVLSESVISMTNGIKNNAKTMYIV